MRDRVDFHHLTSSLSFKTLFFSFSADPGKRYWLAGRAKRCSRVCRVRECTRRCCSNVETSSAVGGVPAKAVVSSFERYKRVTSSRGSV